MIFFYLLVSVMPLMRHPIWSELIGELTVVKYLGAATVAYAACCLLTRSVRPGLVATVQSRWFLLFAAWATSSYFIRGSDGPFELSPMMSYISFLLLFFTTLIVVDTVDRLRSVTLVAIGSLGFASLHVLREWQKYGQFSSGYRPGWVTGDPNYYSISVLLCLPLAYHLLRTPQPEWVRWFCAISLGLALLGLTAAASRGGLLGLMVAVAIEVVRTRRRLRLLAVITAVLVPLMLIAPASPLTRLLSPTPSDQGSTDIRLSLWKAGLRMVETNPFMGVGVGNFKEMASLYGAEVDDEGLNRVAHNTHLEVAAEMGLPGLFLFWGLLASCLISLERVRRAADAGLVRELAGGIQVGVGSVLVAMLFLSAEYQKLLWLLLFLSMCLPRFLDRRENVLSRLGRTEITT